MEDTVIRPTMKFIKLGYAAVLLVIVAGAIGFSMIPQDSEWKTGRGSWLCRRCC